MGRTTLPTTGESVHSCCPNSLLKDTQYADARQCHQQATQSYVQQSRRLSHKMLLYRRPGPLKDFFGRKTRSATDQGDCARAQRASFGVHKDSFGQASASKLPSCQACGRRGGQHDQPGRSDRGLPDLQRDRPLSEHQQGKMCSWTQLR